MRLCLCVHVCVVFRIRFRRCLCMSVEPGSHPLAVLMAEAGGLVGGTSVLSTDCDQNNISLIQTQAWSLAQTRWRRSWQKRAALWAVQCRASCCWRLQRPSSAQASVSMRLNSICENLTTMWAALCRASGFMLLVLATSFIGACVGGLSGFPP